MIILSRVNTSVQYIDIITGTATANNTMSEGDVIFSVSFSNYPADEAFEYVLTSGVDNSYVLGTVALFDFDNGMIKV